MATEIFVSYSRQDSSYLEENSLLGYLKTLKRARFWSDQEILVGEAWDSRIKEAIAHADIWLVLISQRFLDSRYCKRHEVPACLEQSRHKGLIIFPVILSKCKWQRVKWLKTVQCIPTDNQTIERHFRRPPRKRRAIFQKIRENMRKNILAVEKTKRRGASPGLAMTALSRSINTINKMYPQLERFSEGRPELDERHKEHSVDYQGMGDRIIVKWDGNQRTLLPSDLKDLSTRELRHITIFQEALEKSYDRWERLYRRWSKESPRSRKATDVEMRVVISEMEEALDRVLDFIRAVKLEVRDHYEMFRNLIDQESKRLGRSAR